MADLSEEVKDSMQIYNLKNNLTNILYKLLIVFVTLNIVQAFIIFSLLPLKEKVPYLVRFSNASMNFAEVNKADEKISQNKHIKKSLVIAYIINAETKNNIDDKTRKNIISTQSNSNVWKRFKSIYEMKDSVFTNDSLTRNINIIAINMVPNTNFAQVDFQATVKNNNEVIKKSNFRVILEFKFGEMQVKYDDIGNNPTGFKVISYSISKYK